jgi:dipeptidyl aminopeptidase/acylaminoacyl peptidase
LLEVLGCNDAVGPKPSSLSISVNVAGDFPSDRFQIEVDGRAMTLAASEGALVLKGLPQGPHTVALLGLPQNCVVDGVNPRTVETVADLFTVVFELSCVPGGTLAFVSTRDGEPHIYLSSVTGADIRRLTNQLPAEFAPAWSPNGERLAFNSFDGTYVINRDGSGLRRLQNGGHSPSWDPDSKRLLVTDTLGFRIISVDDANASVVNIDIQSDAETPRIVAAWEGVWSPDGSRIAFTAFDDQDLIRLVVMNLNGTGAQEIVKPSGHAIWDECGPEWSPDGQQIAVLSMLFRSTATVNASGGELQSIFSPGTSCWDDSAGGEQSSSGLGWSPDGKALAVTMRTPSWDGAAPLPQKQQASIAILLAVNHKQLALIPDAYDPTWSK